MSAGLVPVTFQKGGPVEIVAGLSDLMKVSTVEELAKSTSRIISLHEDEFVELALQSRHRAEEFSLGFDEGVDMLFTFLGKKLMESNWELWFSIRSSVAQYRADALPTSIESCPSTHDDTKVMLYMDDRFDFALESTATLLRSKLGAEWRLHVWHSDRNEYTARQTLSAFPCVVYHSLKTLDHASDGIDPRLEGGYQRIWKSDRFLSSLGSSVKYVLTFQADVWFPPEAKFDLAWLEHGLHRAPWCHENNWGYLDPEDRPPESSNAARHSQASLRLACGKWWGVSPQPSGDERYTV